MEKDYFFRLLKIYCKEFHSNFICPLCKKVLEDYNNNNLDLNTYYMIIANHSYIYKKFRFHTFNRLSKNKLEDLTNY